MRRGINTLSKLSSKSLTRQQSLIARFLVEQCRMFSSSGVKLSEGITTTPYLPRASIEEQFFKVFAKKKDLPESTDDGKVVAPAEKLSGVLILGPKGSGKTTFLSKTIRKVREQDSNILENDGVHTIVIDLGSIKSWIQTYSTTNKFQKASSIYLINTLTNQLEKEYERFKKKHEIMLKNEKVEPSTTVTSSNQEQKPIENELTTTEEEEHHETGLKAVVQVLEAWVEYLQEVRNVQEELSEKDISVALAKFMNLLAQNSFSKTVIFCDDYQEMFEHPQTNKAYFTMFPFIEILKLPDNIEFVYACEEKTNLFKYTNTYRGKSEKHNLINFGRLSNEDVDLFLENYKKTNENPLLEHPEEIKRLTNNFIGDIVHLLNNYRSFEDYIRDSKQNYQHKLVKSIFEEKLGNVRKVIAFQKQKDQLESGEFANITIEDKPFTIGDITFNNQEEVTMCMDSSRLNFYNNAFDWYLSRNDYSEKYNSSLMESTLLDTNIWYRISSKNGTKYKFRNSMAESVFKQNLANHLYATKFNLHSTRSERIMSLWLAKTPFPKKRNALILELLARLLEDQSQIIGKVEYRAGKKLEILKEKLKQRIKPKTEIDALLEQEPKLDMKGLSVCLNQPSPLISFFGRDLSDFSKGSLISIKPGSPPFNVNIHEVSSDSQVAEALKSICEKDLLDDIHIVYPKYSLYNDIDVVIATKGESGLDVFTIRIVEGNGFGKKPVDFQDTSNVKNYISVVNSLKSNNFESVNHHFALFALEKTHTNVKNYKLYIPEDLASLLPKVTISYVEDYFTEDTERISQYSEYLQQLEEELKQEENDELNFGDTNTVEAMMSQMGHKNLPWYDKVDM
ncbi:predicted protein [Naegleria gruberi]|uniref:Predicted protein n=1 Tax=Naegleria gruberi TaxID=5762 RepID=D2VTD4_NAEGR|nr:uncharacterized protein NAEGRDRAFT_72260 [Naegleria gruberi]EFC39842.1 predicted protein [Naegleria gruberi]|eukprot:XP_002672586.1 predicted protein [Naegleria gruberi strain NEG-M]